MLPGATAIAVARMFIGDRPDFDVQPLRYGGAEAKTLYFVLGTVAGLLAATGASLGGAWLAHALDLKYRFNAGLWIGGVIGAVLVVGVAGWISTRSVVRVAPRSVLY